MNPVLQKLRKKINLKKDGIVIPSRITISDPVIKLKRLSPTLKEGQKIDGTGIIISDDGYVLTASHVVDGTMPKGYESAYQEPGRTKRINEVYAIIDGKEEKMQVVKYTGGGKGYSGEDLALLKFNRPVTAKFFGISKSVPLTGVEVDLIGYPKGGDKAQMKGKYTGNIRDDFYSTDTIPISGMSGGAMLYRNEIMGVIDAYITQKNNIMVGASVALPKILEFLKDTPVFQNNE